MPVTKGSEINMEVQELNPDFFYLIKLNEPILKVGEETVPIRNVRLHVANSMSEKRSRKRMAGMLTFRLLERMPSNPEATLYLRLEDEKGRSWLSIISVTRDGSLYGDKKALSGLLEEIAAIRWSLGK